MVALKCIFLVTFAGDIIIRTGDCVTLNSVKSNLPFYVARIIYMWAEKPKQEFFHARLYLRGPHTILDETCDPREVFQTNFCENFPLGSIIRKTKVNLLFYYPIILF